jgi:uncharacterized protein YajQ (UPF0234 family)
MIGEQEFHLQQMMDILRQKLVKRKIDLSSLDPGDPVSNLSAARQEIALKQGVDSETAKRMVKAIKAGKTKVQAQIQGDQVRVSGKKRDDLQDAIALLRGEDWGLPIQFTNFRDLASNDQSQSFRARPSRPDARRAVRVGVTREDHSRGVGQDRSRH